MRCGGGFYRTHVWSLASLQFTIRFNSILFADIVLVAMRWKGWIWAWGAGVGGGRGGDPRLASTWARWADNHIHCYLHLHLYLYLYRFCIQGLPKLRPGVVKITFIFMFFLSFPIFSLFCPVYTCISPLKSGGGKCYLGLLRLHTYIGHKILEGEAKQQGVRGIPRDTNVFCYLTKFCSTLFGSLQSWVLTC